MLSLLPLALRKHLINSPVIPHLSTGITGGALKTIEARTHSRPFKLSFWSKVQELLR
jgi:hypothetical protein